jgi:hypothetical protein
MHNDLFDITFTKIQKAFQNLDKKVCRDLVQRTERLNRIDHQNNRAVDFKKNRDAALDQIGIRGDPRNYYKTFVSSYNGRLGARIKKQKKEQEKKLEEPTKATVNSYGQLIMDF